MTHTDIARRARHAALLASSLALLAACGGGDADPTAPAPERTLAPLDAAQSQQATVATATPAAPAVVVKTDAGAPVAGVKVTFSVQRGGGSLARDTATTGADGIARAGAWTLGSTAGINTVHASAQGFTTVVITAFGTAGAVAQLVPVSAGQSAVVGSALATAPSVRATDAHGNAVRNAVVTFSAAQGSIAATVDTTDAEGIATPGTWTLGYSTGAQAITASVGTVTASIGATATTASGCTATPYAIGAQVTGTWEDADCGASGGVPYDRYTFTATQQADFRLTVNGAAGRQLRVRRGSATGPYVALMPVAAVVPSTTNPVSLRYVLAPDTYVIEIAAPSTTERSSYTMSTTVESGISCGIVTWYTPDVTVTGSLAQGDCTFAGAYEDWMLGILPLGTRIRTTLTTQAFRPVIAIKDDRAIDAPVLAREYNAAPGTVVRANWTTTYPGSHEIIVTGFDMTDVGSYSLRIDAIDAANTCVANPFTIGNVVQAGWDASDCTSGGRTYDRYVPATAPRAFRATLNGAADKSVAVLLDGVEIADKHEATTGALFTHWFLKPGAVELRVATPAAGTTYTLGTIADDNITNCRQVFAQQGAVIPAQKLETTDCLFNNAYEDRILLKLTAGTTFTSEMTAGFANVLVLRNLTVSPATIVASDVRSTAGTARLSYVVPTTGFYELIATSYDTGVTGSYTLTIP